MSDSAERTPASSGEQASECPECDSGIVRDAGETRCSECGLVVAEYRIDHGPEWRSFDDRAERRRTGAPLTEGRHDRGLSTEIGRGTDATGTGLSGRKRRRLGRLRRQHNRARLGSKRERNLAHGCSEIARLIGALELPREVREEASRLFREAQSADLLCGRSIETIAAGCVYAACRCGGFVRPPAEIAEYAAVDEEKVTLGYGVLNLELGLEARPQSPTELVPRLASECGAPDRVAARARELAALAVETGIANGRSPSGVAAGCLYLASQEHGVGLTQEAIADAADTSPVTLRQRYRELQAARDGDEA